MASEEKYRAKFAISQSAIKDWKELRPQEWYDKWILKITKRRSSSSLDFGSLLDTLCFTPKQFDKRFIISEVKKPSDKVVAIVTGVFDHIKALNENIKKLNEEDIDGKKVILPAKDYTLEDRAITDKFTLENEYYVGKPDQAYNKVIKDGTEYFQFLTKVGTKIVITEEDRTRAIELKDILFTNKISSGFFNPKKGCRVIFQQQLFADFPIGSENVDVLPLKGMSDIIHINDIRKEIREVDLKYTNDAHLFASYNGPVRKFDYTTQHSYYDFLIKEWIKIFEDGKYANYSVMNPLNCVIDNNKLPYLYEYSQTDLHIKRHGIEGTSIDGWEDILNTIAWHLDKNQWNYPKEHLLNGKIQINIFNKK